MSTEPYTPTVEDIRLQFHLRTASRTGLGGRSRAGRTLSMTLPPLYESREANERVSRRARRREP